MAKRRKHVWGAEGCGFLIFTCLFTCCFLAINALLVSSVYVWLFSYDPEKESRFRQVIHFAGPIVLIVVEWWLFDLLIDYLSPDRTLHPKGKRSRRTG
jgi:hypothetical protein